MGLSHHQNLEEDSMSMRNLAEYVAWAAIFFPLLWSITTPWNGKVEGIEVSPIAAKIVTPVICRSWAIAGAAFVAAFATEWVHLLWLIVPAGFVGAMFKRGHPLYPSIDVTDGIVLEGEPLDWLKADER